MSKKPDAARDSAVSQENRTVLPEESHENKTRTAIWLSPGVIRRMDGWLQEDNCKTRSEFIEKALRFYMGYLASEDTLKYTRELRNLGIPVIFEEQNINSIHPESEFLMGKY